MGHHRGSICNRCLCTMTNIVDTHHYQLIFASTIMLIYILDKRYIKKCTQQYYQCCLVWMQFINPVIRPCQVHFSHNFSILYRTRRIFKPYTMYRSVSLLNTTKINICNIAALAVRFIIGRLAMLCQ